MKTNGAAILVGLVLSLLTNASVALAAERNIYVSSRASAGGDGSIGKPYRSFAEIVWTSVTNWIQAGDSVNINLERGSEFRNSAGVTSPVLTVGAAGVAGRPIVFQAYGSGNLPVINGSVVYSDPTLYRWSPSSVKNEWYLELQQGGNPGVAMPGGVWIDGVYQFNYHYPAGQNKIGALSATNWQYGDGDSLGYSTVYIYQTSDPNTSNFLIEGSQSLSCVYLSRRDYVSFVDIEMKQSGRRGPSEVWPLFYPYQSNHVTIDRCKLHDSSGQDGTVHVMRSQYFTLTNSEVYNCYDPDGNAYGTVIYFESSSAGNCSNFVIAGNMISRQYARLGDLVGSVGNWLSGVPYGASNCRIERNEFYGPAQNAVYFRSGATNNIIRYNFIHDIKGHETGGGIAVQLRDQANNNLVYRNLVANVAGPVMQSDGKNGGPSSTNPACDGNKFYNNTIANGNGSYVTGANGFHFFGANTNLDVKNNVVVSNSGDIVLVGNADDTTYSGVSLDNNRYYKTTTNGSEFIYRGVNYVTLAEMVSAMSGDGFPSDAKSTYGDPMLTSTEPKTKEGFKLRNYSPCVDAGIAVTVETPEDFFGVVTPRGAAMDIGAHEYVIEAPENVRVQPQ